MKDVIFSVLSFVFTIFQSQLSMKMEIATLRHQLFVYQRKGKRPEIKPTDRILWSWISQIWPGWKNALIFVKPATVVAWRRKKFKEHWAKLSKNGKPGRPATDPEIVRLIRNMSKANPFWGSPRIRDELKKIGIKLAKSTIEKYMVKHRKPPSPTWRAFLDNHVRDLVSVDFFVVSTIRNTVLFAFLVLAHDRRRVIHFNVTKHPTAEWTAQQTIEAFPWDTTPRYLLRDRDSIYGQFFQDRVKNMAIKEAKIAPRSPWQTPYVERLIGSIRRECLDHVMVFNEQHLKRILTDYLSYYHQYRTHLSLDSDCPESRPVQTKEMGEVIAFPEVSGLHHHYERRKAA
jgi:putative transposase